MEYGICRLGIVPVRREANHRSEMVTQLLFGEHYSVSEISRDKQWVHVENYYDKYKGWISANQHYTISEEYFNQVNESDYKICLDITSTILFQKSPVHIVMGSIIPISTNELFKMEEQLAFGGESKSLRQKREYDFIRQTALKFLNSPYLWGGKSPFGVDCSGLVQMVFKTAGYYLPRDSGEQVQLGDKISGLKNTLPGDLAFFAKNDRVEHVGIILENQKIIHASGKVRVDEITPQGIMNPETGVITHMEPVYRRII